MESLFDEHEGPVRQVGESREEYKKRMKKEREEFKFYRKKGRRQLKGNNIGSQRRRLLMKQVQRRGPQHD